MENESLLTPNTNEGGQASQEGSAQSAATDETLLNGGKPEDAKPEGETKKEASTEEPKGAPEKYEFQAPEGQTFTGDFLSAYEETARELNLSQDDAQKLIDKLSPVLEKGQIAQIEAVRNEWTAQSRTDKEFGGDKLDENLAVAKKSLDLHGTPEFKALLQNTGLGNHPEIIRFLFRVGKATSEDTFVKGGTGTQESPKDFNSMASKLYPN